MRVIRYVGIAFLIIILLMCLPWYRWFAQPAPEIGANDPEVIAAIAESRRRWPEFVKLFQEHRPNAMGAAFVSFPVSAGGKERVWVLISAIDGGVVRGSIYSEPQHNIERRRGDEVSIPVSEIDDWEYADYKGTFVGPFVEPLLVRLQAEGKSR
jgi:uncharacterized protein YegJ (DUF2314 family)